MIDQRPTKSKTILLLLIVLSLGALTIVATLIAAPPQATQPSTPDDASDFGPPPAARHGSPTTATAPVQTQPVVVLHQSTTIEDARIGSSLEHGVDFILAQFRDGELATAPELPDSERQALDALCVYALVHASQAVSDPRLSIRGKLLPAMLDKLRTYELISDAQKMNRPITYGRSLRAAALAIYDRPVDRAVLKVDVQWLIKAEIAGAYTYDDFYNQMINEGVHPQGSRLQPRSMPQETLQSERTAMLGDDATAPLILAQDFGGGSPDPGFSAGPYPPVSPVPPISPMPPVFPGRSSPQGGSGGGGPHSEGTLGYPPQILTFPRPVPMFPRPTVTWWTSSPPRTASPQGHGGYVGPSVPIKPSAPGSRNIYRPSDRPLPDNQMPNLRIEFPWDNSNSQYGLLGVWAGAEVGIEVPDQYWLDVEKHWLSCEFKTGQWGYRAHDTDGYFAMTCAGVASLLVTHEYLDLPMLKGALGREPYSPGLSAGISWLDQGDNGIATPNPSTHYLGYDLFGIERVGLASGYKFFGNHDWYRELSEGVVALQNPNGSWGRDDHGVDTLVDTAYSLLFLSRGRHPILMTKLKFDKYWDNRPRDVANLAKFASKQLERQINWQIVGIKHNWYDWFDSPVVFIASHQAPHLSKRDYNELRKFVQAGGLIFTHTDLGASNFDQWVGQLAAQIAPGLPLQPIPPTDPIYSLQYKLPTHRPLLGVHNGVRWLLVHCPNDLAMAWQQRSDKTRLSDFQLGLNLFLYAAGKPDLRNRIDSPYLPAPPTPPTKSINLARLKFEGNWNPEPAAWPRFSRYLQWETGQSLNIGVVPIGKLTPLTVPIASLTGTGSPAFSKEQQDVLGEYVKQGGILVIDPCGGDNDFKLDVREKLLPGAFAGAKAIPLPKELSMPMKLRPFSLERLGSSVPQVQLLSLGKGYVVLSPLDLTAALLGTHTWGIDGYQSESAETFLKNVVVWSQRN